jgi:hypothetical protein
MAEVAYSMPVTDGPRTVQVEGMCTLVCTHCSEQAIPLSMYRRNLQLVIEALAKPD